MKKAIKISLGAALALFAFVRCSDWTETEALQYDFPLTESTHGEAYYENLRAYKASPDHVKSFGWYSDWTGTGTDIYGRLVGLPDSMDFVSMWGNNFNLSEAKQADLKEVQTKKGTKVLMCWIANNMGVQTTPASVKDDFTVDGVKYETYEEAMEAFWGWDGVEWSGTADPEDPAYQEHLSKMEASIRKYARSIIDTMNKYGFDGFDLDLEPNYGTPGNIASYAERNHWFLDELSKEMGPASGTGRLLCVDGEPYLLLPEDGLILDHFLIQAYTDSSTSSTDRRILELIDAFSEVLTPEEVVRKTILTSNFESYGNTGGPGYYTREGDRVNQLKGFATYSYPSVNAQIGGIGAFRFSFDKNYAYLREAIGIANPVIK